MCIFKKSIQVVSQHGIKGRDTVVNLAWANTHFWVCNA